ncbi:hypothetical protein POSPLADRAFT_1052635 [Postia placenta MAD-698-R-SB12]|uniref:F-box domain-containing protein n=1 Tax=Postia placenta MAD-698-R-SB12 TaxID=670580 RepID=A0A1X6NBF6_9APHY|nr:hypothetical protein POSPLADRAFT_1052635 [Postia placenta MAD-698-R-SB12]OSX65975.1 hypothetical protein POSPLADRAFT_1052635 [Postia placenta MAD-698-R-SB12]
MVQPFPNEIWLDIFEGLLEEGECDALERCRVVCRDFEPMARECLRGFMVFKNIEEVESIKVDVPGTKTGADRFHIWRHSRRGSQGDGPALVGCGSPGRYLDLDAILRDLAAFSIIRLNLSDVTLPSILTLGQLVCALPRLKWLTLHDVRFIQHPRDASTISRFHLLPRTQLEILVLDHGSVDTELRPSFAELVDLLAAVSNRRFPVALPNLAQASPWSVVRRLYLDNVTVPSVTTFARLLCVLPALERLELCGSCVFVKHGFDLRSVPVYPGLPLQLADVDLTYDFRLHSDPCSVIDLVDLFIATGLGENLRRIKGCLAPFFRVANEVDVALNRLVKHSAHSIHLSLDSSLAWWLSNGTDGLVHADHNAAPYFDVSENACLEHLDLTVQATDKNMSHLCASVVEILSQVTSTHISRIQVYFSPYRQPGAELDVDLGKLMNGLCQLDAVLSGAIFNSLANVEVDVRTLDRSDVPDEDSAHELRLCLPRLDARGILGIRINGILMGLHRDEEKGDWARCGVDRVAAQNSVVADEGTSADGDRHSSNATAGALSHEDSDVVSAVSQPVWVSSAAYADAQMPSSFNLMDARVPAEFACDDESLPPDATAGLGTSVDVSALDDYGADGDSSVDSESLV